MTPIKVMDRKKVADNIHTILDTGLGMLKKKSLDKDDFAKIKVIRTISSTLASAVLMVQQETAQERNMLIMKRMEQLGYDVPKQLDR